MTPARVWRHGCPTAGDCFERKVEKDHARVGAKIAGTEKFVAPLPRHSCESFWLSKNFALAFNI